MSLDRPGDDEVIFLPLGGVGEIGMNFALYGHAGKWLIVDCGVGFGDETTPGVDLVMADPAFIEERRDDLVGLFVTHAHEDHIGAIPYLWDRLQCPVYATPFSAEFLRLKLRDSELGGRVPIVETPLSGTRDIGPFSIELITVTHSVPEPNALAIRTKLGLILHSGDWKLDPEPLIGPTADTERLRALGEEGVLALVCDSTNAMEPGRSGSEADVRRALTEVIGARKGRVAVTCFSSNVARLNSIAHAAHANGRHCALVGRSLWRIHAAASATGYVDVPEPFLTEQDAGFVPDDKLVLVVAGSQGEARSAMSRIAFGDHPEITLGAGDTVIYSARDIPGNEKAIGRVQNALSAAGIEVVTAEDAPIHVSGHPGRDELVEMYQWIRPKVAIPVHGETRHLSAHAALAREAQVPQVMVTENGRPVRLTAHDATLLEDVPAERLGFDGNRLIRLDSGLLRTRTRLVHNGSAVATLVLDRKGKLASDPQISLMGVETPDEQEAAITRLARDVRAAVEKLPTNARRDDEAIHEAARLAIRRGVRQRTGKRPLTDIHVVRL